MMELWNERAEHAILGGLLKDNDAIDRIPYLQPEHFYVGDNQVIFAEICRQTSAGRKVDAITLMEALRDRVPDGMTYLMQLHVNSAGAATIQHHAEIVIERAQRRFLDMVGTDLREAAQNAAESPQSLCNAYAARLDEIVQRKYGKEPVMMADRMVDYLKLIERRMDGLVQPIKTGYRDLDRQLGGGLERGTLTIAAGRPGTGKTAFGLGIARNVAKDGVALFLSLEMSEELIHDRNVSAIAGIPLSWLRSPAQQSTEEWDRLTPAMEKVQKMRILIDDETALSVMAIRAKARQIKRKHGLDLLVIDQLSFITAAKQYDNPAYAIGEITRALVALSKELGCAVLLLAQLNRECEKRPNKRPIMADLAMSGSIEQDAANIFFLYRDELYNEDTPDKGIAEVNVAKQRQGSLGVVALAYEAIYTRFSDLSRPWSPNRESQHKPARRGLAAGLGG
jgi:replicative DNA helicase